jgi:molecular chaperone GrpE
MNKSKDKHHPPEEAKKTARATDVPAPADVEPAQETQTAAEPARSARSEPSGRGEASEQAEAAKLQKAAQEIEQLKDQLLRLRADFDNFRKRSLREKGEIYENANEALMLELLPVIDHFQLALASAREHLADPAFKEGLQLIADQMMGALSKYGLNPFNSEKKPFDPNLHEAISCLPSETEPEGTILAQSRQGYRFNKKILRPAQVVVSSGPPAPRPPETNDQPVKE